MNKIKLLIKNIYNICTKKIIELSNNFKNKNNEYILENQSILLFRITVKPWLIPPPRVRARKFFEGGIN